MSNNHKWVKANLQQAQQAPNEIVNEIAAKLLNLVEKEEITINQLIKINNLAANTERLKNALTWL